MDANSKKVMEKYVAASIEGSSGGTKESPQSVPANKEDSLGGTEKPPKYVVATTEGSLGGTKEAPKFAGVTIEMSLGVTKETPKYVPATIEGSLGGTKEAPKKSTEKALYTMLENTYPGNKAQKIKTEVDVEPIAGISENKDASLSAQTAHKELFTVSKNKAAYEGQPTNSKRRRLHIMLGNTHPGNKAQGIKPDFDVGPIVGTSKNKVASPSAQTAHKKPLTVSKNKAAYEGHPTNSKKRRHIMQENTFPGNKAQGIKPDFDVGPIVGTFKNKDASLSAQTAHKKPLTVSKNKAAYEGHPTNSKMRRHNIMQGNTFPGNKAQGIKPDFDVEPIVGTSKNKDANLSAQTAHKELLTVSKNKADNKGHPNNWERRRPNFAYQENEESLNKKLKTHAQEKALDGMQFKYVLFDQQMPKPVVDPEFMKNARGKIEAMSRRELEDLVIHKMVEEKKSESELQYISTQLFESENQLSTCYDRVAKISKEFNELNSMRTKTSCFTPFAAGQTVTEVPKGESDAAGSTLPSPSGFATMEGPSNGPHVHGTTPFLSYLKRREEKKKLISALDCLKEGKAGKVSPYPGQAPYNSLKKTTQGK